VPAPGLAFSGSKHLGLKYSSRHHPSPKKMKNE